MADVAGRNASDIGLVVQGVLIFLSAVIGVVGFFVQGRLKAKEERRRVEAERQEHMHQLKLKKVRQRIEKLVGPACQLCLSTHTHIMYLQDAIKKLLPDEMERFMAKRTAEYGSTSDFYKGKWSKMYTIVGEEIEDLIRSDPNSKVAQMYLVNVRGMIEDLTIPLAALLVEHNQALQIWADREDFRKRFPCAANNGMARNLFPVQLIRFAAEFKQILKQWDQGNYAFLWAQAQPFPGQITRLFVGMMTELREQENALGLDSHKISEDLPVESGRGDQKEPSKSDPGGASKKSAPVASKYVARAGLATAGVGVVAGGLVAGLKP